MWMEFIEKALKGKPEHILPQPPGIVSVRIDPLTGHQAGATDPVAMFEYFMLPYLPETNEAPVEPEQQEEEPITGPVGAPVEDESEPASAQAIY
jgi:penicillin-binding protein 1A